MISRLSNHTLSYKIFVEVILPVGLMRTRWHTPGDVPTVEGAREVALALATVLAAAAAAHRNITGTSTITSTSTIASNCYY